MVFFASNLSSSIDTTCWILDSGETSHITCSISFLTNSQPLHDFYVHLPNGTRVLVSSFGDVSLSSSLILHNVLYIPSFGVNLISIPALLQDVNCQVTFHTNFCLIQELPSLKVIGKSSLAKGLFILQHSTIPSHTPPTYLVHMFFLLIILLP